MPGLVRIEDISRDLVTGTSSVRATSPSTTGQRHQFELVVATELLRSTPRFWSGAAVVLTCAGDVAHVLVVSRDRIPSWASPTNRLCAALDALVACISAEESRPLRQVILGVAWLSPRTWVHDARYLFERRDMDELPEQLSLWPELPGL